MDAEAAAAPSLAPAVPRIVVVAPSPQIGEKPADPIEVDLNMDAASIAGSVADAAESSAVELEEQEAPLVSGRATAGSSTEPDCSQCVIPMEEPADLPGPSQSSTQPLMQTRARAVPDDDDAVNEYTVPAYQGLIDSYYKLLHFTEAQASLPFLILSLGIPLAGGFMSARYMTECPGNAHIPLFVFLLSVMIGVLTICRIVLVIHTIVRGSEGMRLILLYACLFLSLLIFIIFTLEMLVFWKIESSSSVQSPHYCNLTFYRFAFLFNCYIIVAMVVLVTLRIPSCCLRRPAHLA